MRFVPHYENSATIVVVGIRRIVRELSVDRGEVPFLLSALLFVVAEFPIVPAFDRVIVMMIWSGRMTPPSAKLPRSVYGLFPMMGITFSGRLTMSAFVSSAESSSFV